MRRIGIAIIALAGLVLLLTPSTTEADGPLRATAALIDATGATVGSATFREQRDGRVRVAVSVRSLTAGLHGIHVHAIGSCVPPAFTSAGSHFNPTGALHGAHAGDLGNIRADDRGHARLRLITAQFTLSPGQFSLLDDDGSALVVHAAADDLVTDPTGNSGARVACGAIIANS